MSAREDAGQSQLQQSIQQKLDELRLMDGRIEKRLLHLNRTEQGLRHLFESLRTQVLQAHPLVGQLNELRSQNAQLLEAVIEQVRQRIEAGGQENAPADAGGQPSPAADELAAQVDRVIHAAKCQLDEAIAASTESAHQLVAGIEAKLGELRTVSQNTQTTQNPIDAAADFAGSSLDASVAAFTAQADAALQGARRNLDVQLEQIAGRAKLATQPLLARVEDQRRSAEQQLEAAVAAAEQTLARRADNLRRNAERMMELCEQQLVERIASIRPRTRTAIESIEHAAQQRLAQTMAEMERAVQRAEARASEAIESLRPRAADVAMQLEAEMRQQLKQMEDDAVATTHWLEHRLQRRVDEVTRQVTHALNGQIERIDEQPEPRRTSRPASPVQVQIMVDAQGRPSTPADAAA